MRLVLLLYVVLLAWEVENLTCTCNICGDHTICVVDSVNSHCYAKTFVKGNETIIGKGCYSDTESTMFCNTSSSSWATECCSNHFCNARLRPELPITNSTTEVSIKPNLTGPFPGPFPGPTTEEPTENLPIKCLKYNSRKPLRGNRECFTAIGSCYRLQRLDPVNKTVLYWKYGCMVNCSNETRRRAILECCNTSSCNNDTQHLPEEPPAPITKTHIRTASSTATTAASSTASSTRHNVVSTTLLSPTSTELSHSHSTTSRTNIHSPTPIITNSGEVITIVKDSESDSFSFILVPLCIVYLFVTILVVSLVAVICYKQRQIRRLETTVRVMKVTQKQSHSGSMSNERTNSTNNDGSTSV
ncbi:PREDICTED: uncharacterized protein LOC100632694 isoform X2 [Amphimedon queenslandica]|uniref:Activin types I and II receptor domain-containing protein n=1 Tax=Amphimedon queenslandica TaxID=400682 RepID=A0A1X7VRX7_AMPQE|nr:PREDICTED: uncharacterized protein LOC100632694 isoform X2 [Amphimedon queenslandica]|eukprot:XP_019857496.1 PREDICTED: uncharacterized protein LOC100632694 isoform X2 [Amphimedon queenslandica]